MKGSFEEQADSLYRLVGRPIMTANEGRARLNLPASPTTPTADQLAMPLNTTTGPTSIPVKPLPTVALPVTAPIIARTWDRQRDRLTKLPAPIARRPSTSRAGTASSPPTSSRSCAPTATTIRAATAARVAATVNADTLQLLVVEEDAFSPAREAALYG